jgi:Na+-transporting methylmalonyl-CoA/oxaloacetate decarboxylase gamma subunit
MMEVFKQSLTLMWQGMLAIFVVIFLIYLVLSLFPKIFKNNK